MVPSVRRLNGVAAEHSLAEFAWWRRREIAAMTHEEATIPAVSRPSSRTELVSRSSNAGKVPWLPGLSASGVWAPVPWCWACLAFGVVVWFRWWVLSSGPFVRGLVPRAQSFLFFCCDQPRAERALRGGRIFQGGATTQEPIFRKLSPKTYDLLRRGTGYREFISTCSLSSPSASLSLLALFQTLRRHRYRLLRQRLNFFTPSRVVLASFRDPQLFWPCVSALFSKSEHGSSSGSTFRCGSHVASVCCKAGYSQNAGFFKVFVVTCEPMNCVLAETPHTQTFFRYTCVSVKGFCSMQSCRFLRCLSCDVQVDQLRSC